MVFYALAESFIFYLHFINTNNAKSLKLVEYVSVKPYSLSLVWILYKCWRLKV
jgi:hypothetical protein